METQTALPTPTSTLTPMLHASPLRAAITALTRMPEPELLPGLLAQARLPEAQAAHAPLELAER